MRGLRDGYGFVGLIVIFLCGFLTLELGGPMIAAAAEQVKIKKPAEGSTVKGDVSISVSMGAKSSYANVYVDGVYLDPLRVRFRGQRPMSPTAIIRFQPKPTTLITSWSASPRNRFMLKIRLRPRHLRRPAG